MPTTISLANYKTALAALIDAVAAGDWDEANTQYLTAVAQNAGLPTKMGDEGSFSERQASLAELKKAIDAAQAASTAAADTRRLVVGRTGFQGANR